MTSAADILRERAARNEQHIKFAEQSPRQATREKASRYRREIAEWRAVADLMVMLAAQDKCPCCGMKYAKHEDWCVLAAIERLIAGESNATSK